MLRLVIHFITKFHYPKWLTMAIVVKKAAVNYWLTCGHYHDRFDGVCCWSELFKWTQRSFLHDFDRRNDCSNSLNCCIPPAKENPFITRPLWIYKDYTWCKLESGARRAHYLDELFVVGRNYMIHLEMSARNEHLLTLLQQRRNQCRTQRLAERLRTLLRQVLRSIQYDFIKNEWTSHAVDGANAKILQIRCTYRYEKSSYLDDATRETKRDLLTQFLRAV